MRVGTNLDMARAFRIAMAHAGMETHLDLVEASGVSREYIWRVMKGGSHPSLVVLDKVATACKVPVSRLIQWAEGGDA
jgi:transcriptional regulator with XRE-family HTH domain